MKIRKPLIALLVGLVSLVLMVAISVASPLPVEVNPAQMPTPDPTMEWPVYLKTPQEHLKDFGCSARPAQTIVDLNGPQLHVYAGDPIYITEKHPKGYTCAEVNYKVASIYIKISKTDNFWYGIFIDSRQHFFLQQLVGVFS